MYDQTNFLTLHWLWNANRFDTAYLNGWMGIDISYLSDIQYFKMFIFRANIQNRMLLLKCHWGKDTWNIVICKKKNDMQKVHWLLEKIFLSLPLSAFSGDVSQSRRIPIQNSRWWDGRDGHIRYPVGLVLLGRMWKVAHVSGISFLGCSRMDLDSLSILLLMDKMSTSKPERNKTLKEIR